MLYTGCLTLMVKMIEHLAKCIARWYNRQSRGYLIMKMNIGKALASLFGRKDKRGKAPKAVPPMPPISGLRGAINTATRWGGFIQPSAHNNTKAYLQKTIDKYTGFIPGKHSRYAQLYPRQWQSMTPAQRQAWKANG